MTGRLVELLIIGLIVLVLFGKRLPNVLGDLGKGVKAFKEGLDGGEDTAEAAPRKAPAKRKAASRKGK